MKDNSYFTFTENEFASLSDEECKNIDGGIFPILLVGAALLLASCGNKQENINNGGTPTNIQCENCIIIIGDSTASVIQK